jgi:hypothetical protein
MSLDLVFWQPMVSTKNLGSRVEMGFDTRTEVEDISQKSNAWYVCMSNSGFVPKQLSRI